MAGKEIPKSIKASLYIDGKPAESSLKSIRQNTQSLRKDLDGLTYGTDAWKKKLAELQQSERTLRSIQNEVKGVGGAFGWLKTEVGKLGALAVGYLGFQFISEKFQNIITGNAKLSDSLANVRQTTGLTENQVRELNEELKKIDTRTAQDQLLKIAEIGGQFNVPTDQMNGFVDSINQANVVLGGEFGGGAEQITTELSLLRNVFSDIKSDRIDQDLSFIGNALVTLAQEGAATAPVVTDFAKRLAPLEATAKLTSGAVLGLSATLQELAVNPERGGTAVVRLFDKMISNASAFAKVAGVGADEFKNLIQTNSMGAFVKVLEGFKKGGKDVAGLNNVIEELEVSGVGAKEVLVKLSENTQLLADRTNLATEALTNNKAITEQYAVKNENFAAQLDKLGKAFGRLTANTSLVDLMTNSVIAISKSIDWISSHATALSNMVKVMAIAAIAWGTYKVAMVIANAEKRAWIKTLIAAQTLEKLDIILTTSLGLAKALLTGNLKKARQEWLLLNAAMSTNPYALAIAGIVALGTALYMFRSKVTEAQKAQKLLNEVQLEATKNAAEEKNRIKSLTDVISNHNLSLAQRAQAINKLRDIMPDYLRGYSMEEILAGKASKAIDKYINSIEARAKSEAALKKLTELDEKKQALDQKEKLGFKNASLGDLWEAAGNATGGKSSSQAFYEKIKKDRAQIEKEQELLRKVINKNVVEEFKNTAGSDAPGGSSGSGNSLNALREKLKQVKEAYENAAIGSKEFYTTAKEIAELEKEIAKYDNKDSSKKAESEAEKRKKLFNDAEQERIASLEREAQALMDAYAKELSETDEHFRKLKHKHSTNAAAVAQIEKERIAKIKQLEEKFRKEDLARLQDIQRELSQLATQAIENDTERELAELRQATDEKLQQLQDENARILNSIEKQSASVAKLKREGKIEEAQILEEAIAREWQMLEGNGKIREQIIADQIKREAAIKAEAAQNKKLSELEAGVIDAESGGDYQKHIDAQIELLNYKHDLEIANAEKTGASVAEIEARYRAQKKQLEEDYENQKHEFQIGVAQQVSDSLFSIIGNSQKAQSDATIANYERQREKELSNKNLTEQQKSQINAKYDARVKKEKERAWKSEQRASIAQAIINGALAITKVMAQTGVLSPFAIPAIVAGTALQVGTIALQKMPQFAEGGFSNEDPAGYVGQPTIFKRSSSGRPFMAGEAGKEWIAPNWMVKSPRYANLIGMLEAARQEKRAYAAGGSTGTPISAAPLLQDNTALVGMMGEMLTEFRRFKEIPVAFYHGAYEESNARRVDIRDNSTIGPLS